MADGRRADRPEPSVIRLPERCDEAPVGITTRLHSESDRLPYQIEPPS